MPFQYSARAGASILYLYQDSTLVERHTLAAVHNAESTCSNKRYRLRCMYRLRRIIRTS